MTETLTAACPNCGNNGPHTVLSDPRDDQFSHLVPVQCANTDCAREFPINTVTGQAVPFPADAAP